MWCLDYKLTTLSATDLRIRRQNHHPIAMNPQGVPARSQLTVYRTTNHAPTIADNFARAQEAAAAIPPDDRTRSVALHMLGSAFRSRFMRSGGLEDLAEAIKYNEKAIKEYTETPLLDRAALLHASSTLFLLKFQRLGVLADLEQAFDRSQKALVGTPLESPDRRSRLEHMTLLSKVKSELPERDLTVLQQMITKLERRLETFTPGHRYLPTIMNDLGGLLVVRYYRLRVLADIDRAIKLVEGVLDVTPLHNPHRATMMYYLSHRNCVRFERLGDVTARETAIKWGGRAVAIAASDNRLLPLMLTSLGDMIRVRYEEFGDPQDLVDGFRHAKRAVALTHSRDGPSSFCLGSWFRSRFDRLRSLPDLGRAIKWHERALQCTPSDLERRAMISHELFTHFHKRFRRLGVLTDLAHGIKLGEETMALTPPGTSGWALTSHALSVLIVDRFMCLGELDDINRAIKCGEQAVTATPSDHPERWYRISSLADYHSRRFPRSRDIRDIEYAMQWSEKAMLSTPPEHHDWSVILSNFAVVMSIRFQHLGVSDGFEPAIRSLEEAVARMPADHPKRVDVLHNLACMLENRFARWGSIEDLEQMQKWTEETLRATPTDDYRRPMMLFSSGISLQKRFTSLNNVDDLEQAIKFAIQAVAVTPPGHTQRVAVISFLGSLFRTRYEHLGESEDLKNAIQCGLMMAISSPNDPRHTSYLTEFGLSLAARLDQPAAYSGEAADTCFRIFLDAWNCRTSTPRERIRAAIFGGRVLTTACRWQEAASLVEGAVKILATVSPRILGRSDQQFGLSEFDSLASHAGALALQGGASASHCLRLLEHGRGIITGHVIDCRSDLSDLQEHHAEIFNRFNLLRTQIDSPFMASEISAQSTDTDMSGRERRVQAIQELDRTLADIRQLPGFDGFLFPPSAEDLVRMAAEGPIIIVNNHRARNDAIIVTTAGIQALNLPKLHYSDIQRHMKQLTQELVRGNRSTYPSRNKRMAELLLWLWDVVVEPVFVELEFSAVDDCHIPRIWWIGVGLLGMAPFHAAGDHSAGSTRNTISRAISSYVTTIKALSYARQKKFELLSTPEAGLLLVTMATTPGHGSLVFATQEATDIAHVAAGTVTLCLDQPSAAEVLEQLPAYHAIHFSCHGVSDGQNPSMSHLLLRKVDPQSGAAEVDQLTVGAISSVNLKHAQLAFLGACWTADNPSTDLADESIHIASGFQLAGFSHVLATLWESRDDVCRQVAVDFYRLLFDSKGGEREHHRAVSTAFHHAVRKCRERHLTQPLLWALFIHTGA